MSDQNYSWKCEICGKTISSKSKGGLRGAKSYHLKKSKDHQKKPEATPKVTPKVTPKATLERSPIQQSPIQRSPIQPTGEVLLMMKQLMDKVHELEQKVKRMDDYATLCLGTFIAVWNNGDEFTREQLRKDETFFCKLRNELLGSNIDRIKKINDIKEGKQREEKQKQIQKINAKVVKLKKKRMELNNYMEDALMKGEDCLDKEEEIQKINKNIRDALAELATLSQNLPKKEPKVVIKTEPIFISENVLESKQEEPIPPIEKKNENNESAKTDIYNSLTKTYQEFKDCNAEMRRLSGQIDNLSIKYQNQRDKKRRWQAKRELAQAQRKYNQANKDKEWCLGRIGSTLKDAREYDPQNWLEVSWKTLEGIDECVVVGGQNSQGLNDLIHHIKVRKKEMGLQVQDIGLEDIDY